MNTIFSRAISTQSQSFSSSSCAIYLRVDPAELVTHSPRVQSAEFYLLFFSCNSENYLRDWMEISLQHSEAHTPVNFCLLSFSQFIVTGCLTVKDKNSKTLVSPFCDFCVICNLLLANVNTCSASSLRVKPLILRYLSGNTYQICRPDSCLPMPLSALPSHTFSYFPSE